jgi:hypothetical protein
MYVHYRTSSLDDEHSFCSAFEEVSLAFRNRLSLATVELNLRIL